MGNAAQKQLTQLITNDHNAAATQDKVRKTFELYDTDHSSFLDAKEFARFGKDLLDIIEELADLSRLDVTQGKDENEWFKAEFKAMDGNGDGKISFQEFNEYIWNTYKITFSTGATTSKYHGVSAMAAPKK